MKSLHLIFSFVFIVGLLPRVSIGDAVMTLRQNGISYVIALNNSEYRSRFYACLGQKSSFSCILHLHKYSGTHGKYYVTSVEQINNSTDSNFLAYKCDVQCIPTWNNCINKTVNCVRVYNYQCLPFHKCDHNFFELQWKNLDDSLKDHDLINCQSLPWCDEYSYVAPFVITSTATKITYKVTSSEYNYTTLKNTTLISDVSHNDLSTTHIAIIIVVVIIVVIVLISVSFYCVRKRKNLNESRLGNSTYVNDLALDTRNLNNNNVISKDIVTQASNTPDNVDTSYTHVYDQYKMSNHTQVDCSLPTEVCSNSHNVNTSSNIPRKGNVYNNTDTNTSVPLNKDYAKLGDQILTVAHHDYNCLLPESSSSQEFIETPAEVLNVNTSEVTAIQKVDLPMTDTSANPYELAKIV